MEEQMVKPKKNFAKVLSFFVIGLLLLGAGAGVYYYYTQKPASTEVISENPPALKMSTLQGKSVETGYLVFSAEDEAKNAADSDYATYSKGINMFYTEADLTIADIISKVKAHNGQRLLVAYYDTTVKNFYTYPVGPYQGTFLAAENTVLPKYQGVYLISDKPLEVLKNSGIKPASEFASSYSFNLASDTKGWVLAAVPADAKTASGFKNFFKTDTGRINKVFLQTDQTNFAQKIEDMNNVTVGNYALVWLLVTDQTTAAATTSTTTTTTTTPAVVCGDNIKADNEACDDGNTNSGDGCSANCTVESDICSNMTGAQYSLPSGYTLEGALCVKCGDGKKEGTEACDDGNLTAGDGCSATCTTESTSTGSTGFTIVPINVCGDGKVGGNEVCDDGNKVDGDGCTKDCKIEIAPLQPIQPIVIPLGIGTTNDVEPRITVTHLTKTGGGVGNLQDDIYSEKTPGQNDPVWCMEVAYSGNPNSWIKINELKFTDTVKLVVESGGIDQKSDAAFRTRKLVQFLGGSSATNPVVILNYPWRTNLYRLIKTNVSAPATLITQVTSHITDGTSDSPLFSSDDFVADNSNMIEAGKTGYFCLIHNTDQYLLTHSDDPDWVEGGAYLENIIFMDSTGNLFSKTDDNVELVNFPSGELVTTQLR